MPLVNEAASRPGPNYQPPMDAAALAERLGEANPLAVMNWFCGDDVPDFEQADRLATYLGCSARWLKFGEGHPFAFSSPRRLNGHGSAYDDARALLTPDAAGNLSGWTNNVPVTSSPITPARQNRSLTMKDEIRHEKPVEVNLRLGAAGLAPGIQ